MAEATERPAIARESHLVAPDNWTARARAKLSAWMVKLLWASLALLAVWSIVETGRLAAHRTAWAAVPLALWRHPTPWFLLACAVVSLWLRILMGQPAPREADPPLPAGLEVHESRAYKALSWTAITLNKLWICALVLLVVWLPVATASRQAACVAVPGQSLGTSLDYCSVLITPTATFLAGSAIVSFGLQIVLGLAGTVVGRQVVEMASASDEVGARR